jgi:hypothetical protein
LKKRNTTGANNLFGTINPIIPPTKPTREELITADIPKFFCRTYVITAPNAALIIRNRFITFLLEYQIIMIIGRRFNPAQNRLLS